MLDTCQLCQCMMSTEHYNFDKYHWLQYKAKIGRKGTSQLLNMNCRLAHRPHRIDTMFDWCKFCMDINISGTPLTKHLGNIRLGIWLGICWVSKIYHSCMSGKYQPINTRRSAQHTGNKRNQEDMFWKDTSSSIQTYSNSSLEKKS